MNDVLNIAFITQIDIGELRSIFATISENF